MTTITDQQATDAVKVASASSAAFRSPSEQITAILRAAWPHVPADNLPDEAHDAALAAVVKVRDAGETGTPVVRVALIAAAPHMPAAPLPTLRPVSGGPDSGHEWDEDGEPTTPWVGWDISFGCRVSFGPCDLYDGTPFAVTVAISDDVQRAGIAKREVTLAMVRDYANRLLAMCDEVDAATVTHVVMDSSDTPECVDDCPGCVPSADTFDPAGPEPDASVLVLHDPAGADVNGGYLHRAPESGWWWSDNPDGPSAPSVWLSTRGLEWGVPDGTIRGRAQGPLVVVRRATEDGA